MCNISRSFEIKHRSEITDYGYYRPGILFGSFTAEDVSMILAYCEKCDYSGIVDDPKAKAIRVDNLITGRWGWIKKLWACIDPKKETYAAQFVYGFFEGRKWRSKYCINDNLIKLGERLIVIKTQDRVDNTGWPYIIYLPDLEPDNVRGKIASIRGSKVRCFA